MSASPLSLHAAQHDMRQAYYGGAPGMMVSAFVWLIAALVAWRVSPNHAVWALFIGGMLIHPLSLAVLRVMGRSASHTPGNALATLALASTFWMILCLPLAYVVSTVRLAWFFPAMMMIIGGRYLTFATMFGERAYWACGGALALAAYAVVSLRANVVTGAAVGSAIEAVFAVIIALRFRGSARA